MPNLTHALRHATNQPRCQRLEGRRKTLGTRKLKSLLQHLVIGSTVNRLVQPTVQPYLYSPNLTHALRHATNQPRCQRLEGRRKTLGTRKIKSLLQHLVVGSTVNRLVQPYLYSPRYSNKTKTSELVRISVVTYSSCVFYCPRELCPSIESQEKAEYSVQATIEVLLRYSF